MHCYFNNRNNMKKNNKKIRSWKHWFRREQPILMVNASQSLEIFFNTNRIRRRDKQGRTAKISFFVVSQLNTRKHVRFLAVHSTTTCERATGPHLAHVALLGLRTRSPQKTRPVFRNRILSSRVSSFLPRTDGFCSENSNLGFVWAFAKDHGGVQKQIHGYGGFSEP